MTEIVVIVCLAFDHRAPVDGLATFKACLRSCPMVDSAMEVTGAFDMVVEGRCASLDELNAGMERLRPQLAQFATRVETNLVVRRCERRREADEVAMWLPCEGGRRRIAAEQVDKVVAEGDYMRVHVGGWSCLIHQTMARLCEQLPAASFTRLHRSCLVRLGFIDRLVHQGRRWTAVLKDESRVPVAQSHVQEVLRAGGAESSKLVPSPSKSVQLNRSPSVT
jgi:two-component system response regulator AlgR